MALEITEAPVARPAALDAAATATALGATDVAAVLLLIESATAAFEELAQRKLWYRGYLEMLNQSYSRSLYLCARPLVSVEEIKAGEDGDPLVEGVEPDEFKIWSRDGFLFRASGWGSLGVLELWSSGGPWGRSKVCPPEWLASYHAGWYLKSMTDALPPGALRLEDDRPEIARAIYNIVETWYRHDTRRTKDPNIKRRKVGIKEAEWHNVATGETLTIPKSAHDLACSFRQLVG